MATDTIEVQRLDVRTALVPIVGRTPLIVHKWSEKAKAMMLDAQMGKKRIKEPKNPEEQWRECLYKIKTGGDTEVYGFPAIGFKLACVDACRFFDRKVSMTLCKQVLFVDGEPDENNEQMLVKINGIPQMREDAVRLSGGGTADLRYRAMFPEWSATLNVQYVSNVIDINSVVSLIEAGGMGVGVGDWRPERGGEFGTYAVSGDVELVAR